MCNKRNRGSQLGSTLREIVRRKRIKLNFDNHIEMRRVKRLGFSLRCTSIPNVRPSLIFGFYSEIFIVLFFIGILSGR